MITRSSRIVAASIVLLAFSLIAPVAQALPAFARRYNFKCSVCHTNGAAPHLTEFGYIFRRMAFHLPGELGNKQADAQGMTITNHMAVGVNVGYKYSATTAAGSTTLNDNGIEIPEVEIWPLVGGFLGNWGVWSEMDAAPPTSGGGLAMGMADVRYAFGTPNLFYNFRAGWLAPEGYGASDQWLDDGNIPLMDQLSPFKNQNTLALPFGAMGEGVQQGFEAGLNYRESHLTLGYYDGFDGTSGSIAPANIKAHGAGSRDVKVQLDQFVGNIGEVTLGYYNGSIPLVFGAGPDTWLDDFNQERIYVTYHAVPKVDIVAGAGWAQNHYVTTTTTPEGTFDSNGGFVGAFYYALPHLVIALRGDKYNYNSSQSATGYSLQASIPYSNRILVFHINSTVSALSEDAIAQGQTTDVGVVLRFLM